MTVKPNKPTVLVVDDDSVIRDTLRAGEFEIAGEAANGETALELCRKLRPGVVLLDINMPGMDGLMVLRAIHKQFPATKVVMISAEATMERVKEAIACGAAGFIVKPFNLESSVERAGVCGFPGAGHTRQPTAWAQEAQLCCMVVPLQGVATPPCARKTVQSSQSRSHHTGEREMHNKVV